MQIYRRNKNVISVKVGGDEYVFPGYVTADTIAYGLGVTIKEVTEHEFVLSASHNSNGGITVTLPSWMNLLPINSGPGFEDNDAIYDVAYTIAATSKRLASYWVSQIKSALQGASIYFAQQQVPDGKLSMLASKLPGLNTRTNYPKNTKRAHLEDPLRTIIIYLNDTEQWTQSQIADWLDEEAAAGKINIEFGAEPEEKPEVENAALATALKFALPDVSISGQVFDGKPKVWWPNNKDAESWKPDWEFSGYHGPDVITYKIEQDSELLQQLMGSDWSKESTYWFDKKEK